ncbi:MAG TPA: beta-ketoacyl synthase N-terminal-like domain-containing protein [Polyangiales bacterium]
MTDPNATAEDTNAIAIIGMAGRFPGARNVEELWRVIVEGRDTLSHFTPQECDEGDPDLEAVRAADNYVRARGVLDGIEDFDAGFFDFSPAEAAGTDPQHRLWLEVAWEALESAGYARKGHGQVVSVFAGSSANTYLLHNLLTDRSAVEEYVRMRRARSFATLLQNDPAFLPARTAYKLDLHGPAINVQTACSTSLVAIAQAVTSLRNYESDIGLAGGVCIAIPQRTGYFYQEGAIFSRDGVCRPYDAKACGTVLGNGAGAVVLKRLSDARRDGDPVRALILGAALNNDGHAKVGFAAPSVAGQAEVIVAAQAVAGVSPDSIGYVEGHGTATPMGDPIEVEALTRAFRAGTQRTQYCALGSLKGNVGHLDAAAGVAGLIRAVLALEHRTLPPTAHFKTPNPELRIEQTPFFVCETARPWPTGDAPRRAGVSSFGIGGTNAHVVLEQAEPVGFASTTAERSEPHTLILSAKDAAALDANTERLADWMQARVATQAALPLLSDVAFTLRERKQLFEQRRAIPVDGWADAVRALRDPERWASGVATTHKPKLVFVFPGQGSLRAGQLAPLMAADQAFQATLAHVSNAASELIAFDLLRWFSDPQADVGALRADNAKSQLAVFCIDVALARWLEQNGAHADGFLGHSLGEWAAAHLAGVLDLQDAVRAVYHRGRLMQSTGPGAALIVRVSERDAARYAVGEVALACVNGPQLVLLSGPVAAIESCIARLQIDGVAHRRAPLDVAVHSACMDGVIEPFRAELSSLRWSEAHRPILSSVTGNWLDPTQVRSTTYWARQIREPVLFDRAVETLFTEPCCIALEVGLGNGLTGLLAARRRDKREQRALAALGPHDEGAPQASTRLRQCLGELFANGAALEVGGPLPPPTSAPVLPTYAFQRRRYFVDPPAASLRAADVERRRVPSTPPPAPTSAASAPIDLLRAELVLAISALSRLPVAEIDPLARFADLGLDSVFLAQLSEDLQERLGLTVRFSQLVHYDTVERLAQALVEQRAQSIGYATAAKVSTDFRGLIRLHNGDDTLPMLLVHGDWADHLLPPRLPAEQSLYGYLHQGSDGERMRLRSVEALAALCHAEWLAVCGDRPCILGGHSFGGLVAYHVAQLRRRAGLPVSLLVLIDTYHPASLRAPRELGLRAGTRLAREAVRTLAWAREIARSELWLAQGKRIPVERRTDYVRAIYGLATLRYQPAAIDVDLLLFRATERWVQEAPGTGWRTLTGGHFEVQDIKGNHLHIVRTKEGFSPIASALVQRIVALRSAASVDPHA